jgi:hypothetical protein
MLSMAARPHSFDSRGWNVRASLGRGTFLAERIRGAGPDYRVHLTLEGGPSKLFAWAGFFLG